MELGSYFLFLQEQIKDIIIIISTVSSRTWLRIREAASIGSLLTSSYAERINSAANLLLTKGNTCLAEEELIMCTVLRMNRSFMELMRKYHPDVAKQQFKMTEDFSL
jgi:hypothetical protein